MTMLTVKIENDSIADKIKWLLQHFTKDGVQVFDDSIETIAKDDQDYNLLKQSKGEERVSFNDYLKNENRTL